MSTSTAVPVMTADTRAVAVPGSLGELRGPRHGRMQLPPSVYWGPRPDVDLRFWDDVAKAYEATLREGDLDDVRALVNPHLLAEVWADIVLPRAVRAAWERRFASLAGR